MHNLIWWAVIGLITGWLAGILVQGKGMGVLPDIVVGILGALIGGYLSQFLHIPVDGFWQSLGVSIMGAVVLLVILRMIKTSK